MKRDECREWGLGIQKMREEWEREQNSNSNDERT